MDGLLQDFRLAWRGIRAKPGFSIVVIVTLALGIGVNTAVFSLANWVMLRPVPGVSDPGRLVTIEIKDHRGGNGSTSYPNVNSLRDQVPALAALAGEGRDYPMPVRIGNERPTLPRALFVSSGYFDALGVPLALGRSFTPAEEATEQAAPVVVVSHAFWSGPLHADRGAIGRYITIGGDHARIVGVAPANFHGSDLLADIDLWVPGAALRPIPGITENRQFGVFFYLRGRLAPGASLATAETQIKTQVARLIQAFPEENKSWLADAPVVTPGIGMVPSAQASVRHTLTIIGAIALLVLVVACANVANLYLFRAVARRQSVGIRRALGASAARLARGEMAESLLAASIGGIGALVATAWTLGLFRGRLFSALSHDVTTRLDWRVFVFALCAMIVTGGLAGLAPAWAAARIDLAPIIKGGLGTHTGRRTSVYGILVALQLSISIALIVTTLLLVQTVRNLEHVKVGFDADKVVALSVAPSMTGYAVPDAQRMMTTTMDRLRATRGVENAALTAYTPFTYSIADRVRLSESPSDSGVPSTTVWATPGYFETMGIHLLRGRTFDVTEEFRSSNDSAYHVVVLSSSLARLLFPAGDAIGRIVIAHNQWARVVGVVADSRWASVVDDGQGPNAYSPLPGIAGYGFILVRSRLSLADVEHDVQGIMAEVSPNTPVGEASRLSENVRSTFAEHILLSRILTAFAFITIALAGVGLYGVISFAAAQRTREIGIRMALGAQVGQIIGMVLRRGAVIGAAGALLGLAGAVALVRVVRSQLFGISAGEPLVYLAAVAVLAAVVLVATWIPARRAASVDPARVLRSE